MSVPRGKKRRFQLSRKLSVVWFVTPDDPPAISYAFIPAAPKKMSGSELRAFRRSRLAAVAMFSRLHPDNPVVHLVEAAGQTLH